jgi:hypothetical protein
MPDGIRWVGLDVHARESTIAVFDQATGEVATKRWSVGHTSFCRCCALWSARRGWSMRRARPVTGSRVGR